MSSRVTARLFTRNSRGPRYTPRMSLEIRSALPEELPEVARVASRELATPIEMFQGMDPSWTLCAIADGQVATTYAAWPLHIRFNGRVIPMAGVTWVSTHPSHRRKGYLRAIVQRHFEQLHDDGQTAWAGLHPALAAIYRRYGYGTITERRTYRVDPRDLTFAHPRDIPGRLREIDPEEGFPLLSDTYHRFAEPRNAMMLRAREMWDAGPLAPPPSGFRSTTLVYEEGGQPLGHVIFHHGDGMHRTTAGPRGQIRIQDLVALTPGATYAFWRTLASYDAVREITWSNASPDDPLPHMLVEPRMLNVAVRDGIMARLVSAGPALELRPYAVDTEVTFRLIDQTCPWNDGKWRLSTGAEGGQMTRIDGQDAEARLDPDTLAQIAWGFLRPSVAWRAGLLDVDDPAILQRWDDAFRTAFPPHEMEHTW